MIFSRNFGNEGDPRVVVMHGLCGSSRNWLSVGEAIAGEGYFVTLLDARDHGMSAWSDELSYDALAQDVIEWWEAQGRPAFTFLGHSMGGKLGMVLATHYQEVIGEAMQRLAIVDIAPKDYSPHYQDSLKACLSLPLGEVESRKHADELLAPKIGNAVFRQFLLSNLYSKEDGSWAWRCNFELILRDLPNLASNPLKISDITQTQTLIIAGSNSNFVEPGDDKLIAEHFPNLQLKFLPTGHNVHIEAREEFVQTLVGWLKK